MQAHRKNEEPAAARSAAEALAAQALTPAALAARTPAAAAVPAHLWARALGDPVLEMLARPGKELRARLTALAYRLGGGTGEPPPALGAILEIVHAGSMVVDDIEDGSSERRGRPTLHRLHGLPLALNAGNWMYFYPFELVDRLALPPAAELALRRRMTAVMLDCHQGQALDLAARVGEVPRRRMGAVALAISTLKTGRLVSLAAAAGALVAGADAVTTRALAAFGEEMGVALQMLDDLGNLSPAAAPEKRFEDLRQGRITWPLAWAAAVLEPRAFARLEDAVRAAGSAADPAPVAAELRATVEAQGRAQAHWALDRALARLRAALPSPAAPLLSLCAAELARLERSYG